MAKRTKRLEKGIESLKEEIESHFAKVEEDINNENFERGHYHIKEISKSLIDALKNKLRILGKEDRDIEKYEDRLKELNDKLEKGIS